MVRGLDTYCIISVGRKMRFTTFVIIYIGMLLLIWSIDLLMGWSREPSTTNVYAMGVALYWAISKKNNG